MKNKELFDKTVSILVNAYQNDTLMHGDCAACAVGNIVSGNGIPRFDTYCINWDGDNLQNSMWKALFVTMGKEQRFNDDLYSEQDRQKAIRVINATGYSISEMAKVEYAFETTERGLNNEDHIFNGLMSVIDTLMQIHEATTEEAKQAKDLFVKIDC